VDQWRSRRRRAEDGEVGENGPRDVGRRVRNVGKESPWDGGIGPTGGRSEEEPGGGVGEAAGETETGRRADEWETVEERGPTVRRPWGEPPHPFVSGGTTGREGWGGPPSLGRESYIPHPVEQYPNDRENVSIGYSNYLLLSSRSVSQPVGRL
jgi:hypothetical protein